MKTLSAVRLDRVPGLPGRLARLVVLLVLALASPAAAQYERAGDRLRPTGELRWTVRMSFVEPSIHTCRLRARDARGGTEIDGPVVDVAASDHPGFLRASASDNRYFEYDDGSPFFPLGDSTGIGQPDETEEEIAIWSAYGINFTRMWLSSRSPFSDPRSSWATHHAMPDNGYLPPSLRTSEERFEEGDFSWKIAAPARIHAKVVIPEKGDWQLNQFDRFGRIDPAHTGVYFVRASWGSEERTERLVLLR